MAPVGGHPPARVSSPSSRASAREDADVIQALTRAGVPKPRAQEIARASSLAREGWTAGDARLTRTSPIIPIDVEGVLKGARREATAVILADGSAVIHTREFLSDGAKRRAKAVLWMERPAEGRVRVDPACKLTAELTEETRKDKTRHGRRFLHTDQRRRELDVQLELARSGAQHVLLPRAAYVREGARARDFQILPRCDRALDAEIANIDRLHPILRLRASLPFLAHAARGVAELHAIGWSHNDVKPENILVRGARAWLGDLDKATALGARRIGGTRGFCRPEFYRAIVQGQELPQGVGTDNDVFALGVTLLEMWRGRRVAIPKGLEDATLSSDAVAQRLRTALERSIERVKAPEVRSLIERATGTQKIPSAAEFAQALVRLQSTL